MQKALLNSVSVSSLLIIMSFGTGVFAQANEPLECLPNSTGPIAADTTPFADGMCNIGASDSDRSVALGISPDGSVVVGTIGPTNDRAAFHWTSDAGITVLDGLTTTNPTSAGTSISSARDAVIVANGTEIIVGQSRNDLGRARAVRWTNGTIEDLGTLLDLPESIGDPADTSQANAAAVNADGTVIVGWSYYAGGPATERRAFRWVEGGDFGGLNPEMQDLGVFSGGDGRSVANDVNAAGNVVVGNVGEDAFPRAFRWVEGGTGGGVGNPQMEDLGTLRIDGSGFATAEAVNTDGTVVVGIASGEAVTEFFAYRWTEGGTQGGGANPEMQSLGTLTTDPAGYSWARDVNADGTVVVGESTTEGGDVQAFRWIEGGEDGVSANPEMQGLGSMRTDGTGFSRAYNVSADGAIVVGEAETDDGSRRAFIWRTQMQDVIDLQGSFPDLANHTEIALASSQTLTCFAGREMQEGIPIGLVASDDYITQKLGADRDSRPAQATLMNECIAVGGRFATLGKTDGLSSESNAYAIGLLSYGRGISASTTLGGTLSVAGNAGDTTAVDMNGVGIAVWAEYSQNSLERTGVQGNFSLSYSKSNGQITRGLNSDLVMQSVGDTSIGSISASAELGYGFHASNWLITPSMSLVTSHFARDAYSEAGGDFNATYDSLSVNRTTSTLAVSGSRSVSDSGTLSISAGIDGDLLADRVKLAGTSDLPGFETFEIDSTMARNETRGFVYSSYSHDLDNNRSLVADIRLGQPAFGDTLLVETGLTFTARF
ncbi:probable extracellular repeat, HAF family [Roseovarius tolerans]|uniref:Probable extracellular repeat, HAF family n=1 Tax=Roseovarius tolerans TaxID=74031 RepID=A0A1H8JRZ5_9RHOB|nr:autotransporter domain-containing protein [Roseovarius tolerans]SEN83127.1 probable extracellular repeat, HAF family [Roseovarius tolerans]